MKKILIDDIFEVRCLKCNSKLGEVKEDFDGGITIKCKKCGKLCTLNK